MYFFKSKQENKQKQMDRELAKKQIEETERKQKELEQKIKDEKEKQYENEKEEILMYYQDLVLKQREDIFYTFGTPKAHCKTCIFSGPLCALNGIDVYESRNRHYYMHVDEKHLKYFDVDYSKSFKSELQFCSNYKPNEALYIYMMENNITIKALMNNSVRCER